MSRNSYNRLNEVLYVPEAMLIDLHICKLKQCIKKVKSRSANKFDSRYEKLYTLGKGNFGKVYLVEDRKSGEQVNVYSIMLP